MLFEPENMNNVVHLHEPIENVEGREVKKNSKSTLFLCGGFVVGYFQNGGSGNAALGQILRGNREVLRCCWCRCEKQIAGLSAAFFRVATATASTTQPVPASLTHAPLALNEDLTRVRTMASHENRNEVQVEAPAISQEPAKPSVTKLPTLRLGQIIVHFFYT